MVTATVRFGLSISLPLAGVRQISQVLINREFTKSLEAGYTLVRPPVGVMVEVPSAVCQAGILAARADLLSVGSNDLTQYLLAVYRNNSRVADWYSGLHPAVLQALQDVVQASHRQGVPVGICGELAGDPPAAALLVAMGFDILSMNSTNLLKIRSVIRGISLPQAERVLEEIMAISSAEEFARHLDEVLEQAELSQLL